MELSEILFHIVRIIFVIFAIIAIIQLILKITGHSPIDVQLLYIVVGGIVSYLFVAHYQMGKFVGKVDEFIKVSKNSFSRIREDISKLREDLKR